MSKSIKALTDVQPQTLNANRHTARGMQALERSIQEDGWIGAITVAADGETFDGSARIEVGVATGFDDAIVVESDGTRPVILKRTDIPTADDPRAKRLGVKANRIPELNLDWSPDMLAALSQETDLSQLFRPDELAALLAEVTTPTPGDGGDEFDATPDDGPTRCQVGDIFVIGGVHRLIVGDCTDAAVVARLMEGERPSVIIADPPYGMNLDTKYSGITLSPKARAKHPKQHDYAPVIGDDAVFNPTALLDLFRDTPEQYWWGADYYRSQLPDGGSWLVWDKRQGVEDVVFDTAAFELCWSKTPHRREIIRARWMGLIGMETQDTDRRVHPTQKPLEVYVWLIEQHTAANDLILDPFAGSGTTLIAAQRLGRRCFCVEIEPRYGDVILKRATAEGMTVERGTE